MLDTLAPLAGLAVGVLVVVAVNGLRRGRPAPVVAPRAKAPTVPGPPPRPYEQPVPAATPGSPAAPAPDYGIKVNYPGSAPAPAAPAAPPPPPPVIEPPAPPPTPVEAATAVAVGPDLAKRPEPAPPPAASAGGRLDLDDGSDGTVLGDEPVSLGRGTDQTLRIKDSRASRHHAVVRRRSKGRSGWEVEDAGSANGTTLNGHTIPEGRVAPLRDGDRIGIGDTTIVFTEATVPAAPEPPPAPSPDDDATRIGP